MGDGNVWRRGGKNDGPKHRSCNFCNMEIQSRRAVSADSSSKFVPRLNTLNIVTMYAKINDNCAYDIGYLFKFRFYIVGSGV